MLAESYAGQRQAAYGHFYKGCNWLHQRGHLLDPDCLDQPAGLPCLHSSCRHLYYAASQQQQLRSAVAGASSGLVLCQVLGAGL